MKHEDHHSGLHQEVSGDATSIDPGHPVCVGPWRIEPRAQQVEGTEGGTRLTPKAKQVLCCLAALPGHVGTKEELLDTVW
jgi:DNA-binding response OmpR family regulator